MIDRSQPRFRLFDLSEEPDGRLMVWYVVEADNTPGRELTSDEAKLMFDLVTKSPWRDGFWVAFQKNKKATVYEPMLLPWKIVDDKPELS